MIKCSLKEILQLCNLITISVLLNFQNVNTCPVDRQPFSLILVRQHLEGKVIRQIPVSQPSNDQVVSEDATFCEVNLLSFNS